MDFQKLTAEKIEEISAFFAGQRTSISVYSAAYLYMWRDELRSPDYAIAGDCLILRGSFGKKAYFYYPVSKTGSVEEELCAIGEIEDYCRERCLPLRYINVPEERLALLVARYADSILSTDRTWNEYLYRSEDFASFPGKKFAGQRNHVHQFEKACPDAVFRVFAPGDEEKLRDFLAEYERTSFRKTDGMAKRELERTRALIGYIADFSLLCGYMERNGKVISLAIGEVCGDTLMEHVEKALRGYPGVYPATAQAFVRAFAGADVRFVNREDDSGDLGLRKSKLQYRPCRLVKKFIIDVQKPLLGITRRPVLHGDRVTLKKIPPSAQAAYYALASDIERNRYWGYDYRDGLNGERADEGYFLRFVEREFRAGDEMSLGIFVGNALIGEVVLYNCGYRGEAEVGARLLPDWEGKGYARESVRLLVDYAFVALGAERVEAKCFLENLASKKMLEGAGMRCIGEDGRYYRFLRTPDM